MAHTLGARLLALMAGFAAMALATTAEARDGCGRGYYFDGYGCRPERRGPPPGYYPPPPPPPGRYGPPPPRYYDPPPPPGPTIQFNLGGGGDNRRYAPPVRGRDGRPTCAQRGYTVQDGLCKPYRGY